MMTGLHVFAVVFAAVALAEVVGDKTLYTVGSLSTRFPPAAVMGGVFAAFGAKALVAVLAGRWIAELPRSIVDWTTAAVCFAAALAIALRPQAGAEEPHPAPLRAATISFSAIFLSEWGDPGQIATAVAAARFAAPVTVWLAATAAMMSKAAVAAAVGGRLRSFVAPRTLRMMAVATCLVAGALSAAGRG